MTFRAPVSEPEFTLRSLDHKCSELPTTHNLTPIHVIPDELSSMLHPTLIFPSYNLQVQGGAEFCGFRSGASTAPVSTSNPHQRAPIFPRGQCQCRMFPWSLAPTEKSAVLMGNIRTSFGKVSYNEGASFNFLILTNWLNRKICLHIGLLLLPYSMHDTVLPECSSWPYP